MGFWNKKIKNVKELSKATGIEEQKLKELKEGKRVIGGETMENVLNKINEINKKSDLEKTIEKKEIDEWIKKQDFKQLRKEFNFATQKELADAIGVSPGTFSDCIKKPEKYNVVATKIYEFFKDDFNKNVIIQKIKTGKRPYRHLKKFETPMLNCLKQFDLDELCKILGCKTHDIFASEIGISRRSLESVFKGNVKKDSKCVAKVYQYVYDKIGDNTQKTGSIEDKVEDNINLLDESKIDVAVSKNTEIKDDTEIEDNIENAKQERNIWIDIILEKEKEISKLKNQIRRYEILIDRLK